MLFYFSLRFYAFPQTPLGKSGPCGAVAPGQCVATGQCFPGSRYARPRWISVFGAKHRGKRVMSDGLERALPGTAERAATTVWTALCSERLLRRMGNSPGGFRVCGGARSPDLDDTLDNAHFFDAVGRPVQVGACEATPKRTTFRWSIVWQGSVSMTSPTIICMRQRSPKASFWFLVRVALRQPVWHVETNYHPERGRSLM